MLQVKSNNVKPLLVMSQCAYESLTTEQIKILQEENELIYSDLQTIETYGGGSARCMMCEVFI
jgi:hypothetical protein